MSKVKPLFLSGKVINQQGKPVPNLKIEGWDKDRIGSDDILGTGSTDENGAFGFNITEKFNELFFDRKPDVYYKVFDGDTELLSSKGNVMMNLTSDPDPVTLTVDYAIADPEPEPDPDPKPEPEPEETSTGNSAYYVQNQWGGSSAPWHDGGVWVLGGRASKPQFVIAMDIESSDDGATFTGTMQYEGEGPIGFKAKNITGNTYSVENQWGGSSAPWHPGGTWLIGGRDQKCVKLNIKSEDNGKTLTGTMVYKGEGPIGFKAELGGGNAYLTENQWGGNSAPWHPGGVWVMGVRGDQKVVKVDVSSEDQGVNLNGTMVYKGEGPIGFKGKLRGDATNTGNNYSVENQWGGSSAPWHPGGIWVIGTRDTQHAIGLNIESTDDGMNFSGTMKYNGEGPIGFRAKFIG